MQSATRQSDDTIDLDGVAFCTIGLQQSKLQGQHAPTHLQKIGKQCSELFAKHFAIGVCLFEVGDVQSGPNAEQQGDVEHHISEACRQTCTDLQFLGTVLC